MPSAAGIGAIEMPLHCCLVPSPFSQICCMLPMIRMNATCVSRVYGCAGLWLPELLAPWAWRGGKIRRRTGPHTRY
eukprot:SAG31_NODE_2518_length_5574_cov_9.105205_6_plen_76_part_00